MCYSLTDGLDLTIKGRTAYRNESLDFLAVRRAEGHWTNIQCIGKQ